MKILHINGNYIFSYLHKSSIEKLDELGIENHVFVPTYNKELGFVNPGKNVIVSECFNKSDRYFFYYKQNKILSAIEKAYDLKTFDLIHSYTLFTDGNVAKELYKKYNIPYVAAIRNTDVNVFFARMLHLRKRGIKIMEDSKKIFFLSKSYEDQVFNQYVPKKYKKIFLEKSEIIPNGIDDFWIKNKPDNKILNKTIDKNNIKLIYVGEICPNKNIESIQMAIDLLRKRGLNSSLSVIGKVIDENYFKQISTHNSTVFFPPVCKEELINYYRDNDIFVMPSHFETFGLVYPEAMSQGLPVIYTKGQGFDGQFPEGTVGYSVDDKNPKNIADRIIDSINNHEFLSKNSIAKADKFTWENICKKYKNIYENLLSH